MKIIPFQYRAGDGFNLSPLPKLDHPEQLLLVFGSPRMDQDKAPFEALESAYPDAVILGCSTAGEILGDSVYDDTLTISLVGFDSTRLALAHITLDEVEGDFAAGQALAEQLASEDLAGVYVLSDGLHVNGSELVRGLNETLGANTIVTGGLAGDGSDFGKTWVLHGSEVKDRQIVAVGFYGDRVDISHGSRGGWDPFGPMRKITRSENNLLFELDDQPALDLYKRYLGDRADELPGAGLLFPLAIRQRSDSEEYLVRTILAVDEDAQSVTFAGDIPEGAYAQLMKANFDRLVDGAEDAAIATGASKKSAPVLSLAVSCVGRRLVMGARIEEELEVTMDNLPEGSHQIGFYSYGELSPIGSARGETALHNQTMTLTVISEN
jgi:hypothetical protein